MSLSKNKIIKIQKQIFELMNVKDFTEKDVDKFLDIAFHSEEAFIESIVFISRFSHTCERFLTIQDIHRHSYYNNQEFRSLTKKVIKGAKDPSYLFFEKLQNPSIKYNDETKFEF